MDRKGTHGQGREAKAVTVFKGNGGQYKMIITKPLIYDMRVECAWCGELLRMSKCVSPGKISHGICEACKERVLGESAEYQAAIQSRAVEAGS